MKTTFAATLLLAFACVSSPAAQTTTNLPTIVCLGDSITRAGFPEEMEKMLPARVINAGVSGNNSRQGLARIERDVLAHKPVAVFVLFGTNDNRQDSPKARVPLAEYEQNLAKIIDACRGVGAKVLLGTLPPIDPEPYFTRHIKEKFDAAGGLEKLVAEYRAAAVKVGKEKNVPVLDLNRLLARDTSWRKPDGVHPTTDGNKVIAKLVADRLREILP